MFAYMKRICAFLLAVVMLFSLLPVGPVHAEEATTSYELTEADWDKIIASGMSFSREVCASFDNYISKEFAAKL